MSSKIQIFNLHLSNAGWNSFIQQCPTTKGVYLHFGLIPHNNGVAWVPLRIGKAANFQTRWGMGLGHQGAFLSMQSNNLRYIAQYPNYAFFFNELRRIPSTKVVLIEWDDNATLERQLQNMLQPVWECTYKYKDNTQWLVPIENAILKWQQEHGDLAIPQVSDEGFQEAIWSLVAETVG